MGKNNESKMITVSNFGFIHTLGIHGPIVAPVSVSVPLIIKTITAGYSVSEVIDGVATPLSIDDLGKKEKEVPAAPAVEVPAQETPVVPEAPATETTTEEVPATEPVTEPIVEAAAPVVEAPVTVEVKADTTKKNEKKNR